jgi:hypothetical protein
MKKNIILTMACLFAFSGASVSALASDAGQHERAKGVYESHLNQFVVDPQLGWKSVQKGLLTLDLYHGEALLSLDISSSCPKNEVCTDVMAAKKVVTLPIVSVSQDNCGATHYVAATDVGADSGEIQTLEILDYSTSRCMMFYMADTVVKYSTETFQTDRGEMKTESRFQGGALQELSPEIAD